MDSDLRITGFPKPGRLIDRPVLRPATGSYRVVSLARPQVRGKSLYTGKSKFFIKGVTYGPFPKNSRGHQLPEPEDMRRDFQLMRQLGINTIRTYIDSPRYLLDLAADEGIKVIAGVAWHLSRNCIYDDPAALQEALESVRREVGAGKGHPAILMYCIGNEIPPLTARWHGKRRIEDFVRALCEETKSIDPDALVTYANHPPTEYLEMNYLDVYAFNVYLEEEEKYNAYLKRLQAIAGDKPLFLSEVGVDAQRNTEEVQAEWLQWTVRNPFEMGLCGTVIFSWTDEWSERGHEVEDWGFGLTTAAREPRLSASVVCGSYSEDLYGQRQEPWPKVSVAVVTYNGAKTLKPCLASLEKLTYPDYEVLVVNDGSTDDTAQIAREFPRVRLVSTENHGLSSGRNTALKFAKGEIIAYTDDDCEVDPDWLYYLATALRDEEIDAVGGPNLPPPDDGEIAQCVALSPGGPDHVLLSPEHAEHIPGCNMAFRTNVLREIGGFDPFFVTAGDDVDVCWRLHGRRSRIGFAASAVVWHRRRDTIRRYLRQQRGYGDAETRLEEKHPRRFNLLGYMIWRGTVESASRFRLPFLGYLLYHGPFCSSGFQTIYQRHIGVLQHLPEMFETYLAVIALAALSPLVGLWTLPVAAAVAALVIARCVRAGVLGSRGFGENRRSRLRRAATVSLLHLLQPLTRGWGRTARLTRKPGILFSRFTRPFVRAFRSLPSIISHAGHAQGHALYHPLNISERDEFIGSVITELQEDRCTVDLPGGWESWDLRARTLPFVKAEVTTAIDDLERDGIKLSEILLARVRVRTSKVLYAVLGGLALQAVLLRSDNSIFWSAAAIAAILLAWHGMKRIALRHKLMTALGAVTEAMGRERITSPDEILERWFGEAS